MFIIPCAVADENFGVGADVEAVVERAPPQTVADKGFDWPLAFAVGAVTFFVAATLAHLVQRKRR